MLKLTIFIFLLVAVVFCKPGRNLLDFSSEEFGGGGGFGRGDSSEERNYYPRGGKI